MPIEYKNTSLIHAWQWAIGLEWYLMVEDPWRVVMSTDHPNGGSFLAYPQIIRLLDGPDLPARHAQDRARARSASRASSPTSTAQYTLSEIAIITRAGPARILGLKNKGHLGPGADADITIYTPNPNQETMFELPRFVIKAGRISSSRARSARNPTARRCTSRPNTTATSSRTSRNGSRNRTRSGGGTILSKSSIFTTTK